MKDRKMKGLKPLGDLKPNFDSIIEMSDANYKKCTSSDWFILGDDGKARLKTAGELKIDADVLIASNLTKAQEELYKACTDYQNTQVDGNTSNELTLGRAFVESGKATSGDLPKSAAVGAWIESLWIEYYTRKATSLDSDFSEFSLCPHSYLELSEERKKLLESI